MSIRLKRIVGHAVVAAATALEPSNALAQKTPKATSQESKSKAKKSKPVKPDYQKPSWPDVAYEKADRPRLLDQIRKQHAKLVEDKASDGAPFILRISLRAKLAEHRWVELMEKPVLSPKEREELGALDTIFNLESIGKAGKAAVLKDADDLKAARTKLAALYPPPKPKDEGKGETKKDAPTPPPKQ